MRSTKLIYRAILQSPHRTNRNTRGLLAGFSQLFAPIALMSQTDVLNMLRDVVRTCLYAILATNALRIIMLNRSVLIIDKHCTIGARRHACGRFAMVARC